MKVALLQLNPTVGDLCGNSDLIACAARQGGRISTWPSPPSWRSWATRHAICFSMQILCSAAWML